VRKRPVITAGNAPRPMPLNHEELRELSDTSEESTTQTDIPVPIALRYANPRVILMYRSNALIDGLMIELW
jgi:hypothetical protein